MRILAVLIVGFILMFTVTVGWYVSQPVVLGISRGINASITNPSGRNVATAVEYVSYAWGPILNIFILVWMLISAGKRDVESEVYG